MPLQHPQSSFLRRNYFHQGLYLSLLPLIPTMIPFFSTVMMFCHSAHSFSWRILHNSAQCGLRCAENSWQTSHDLQSLMDCTSWHPGSGVRTSSGGRNSPAPGPWASIWKNGTHCVRFINWRVLGPFGPQLTSVNRVPINQVQGREQTLPTTNKRPPPL